MATHREAAGHFNKLTKQQEVGIKTKFAKSGEHTIFATIVSSQAQGSQRYGHSLRLRPEWEWKAVYLLRCLQAVLQCVLCCALCAGGK